MVNFVKPQTYLIGYTEINLDSLKEYLKDTEQEEFIADITQAQEQGVSNGEILCSFYAKMCYASLTTKKNLNISKIRDIASNIEGTINSGHGSVFEHCNLNFIVRDASRVYTHEQVRHRVGTAYSQTSGRYVRTDKLNFVFDPILDPVKEDIENILLQIQKSYKSIEEKLDLNNKKNFDEKKKLTSALRRILPNGQANELGFSLNLRSLRNIIPMRTSRHAEWEIRLIYGQVYDLVHEKYKMMFFDENIEMVDGLREITFKNKNL